MDQVKNTNELLWSNHMGSSIWVGNWFYVIGSTFYAEFRWCWTFLCWKIFVLKIPCAQYYHAEYSVPKVQCQEFLRRKFRFLTRSRVARSAGKITMTIFWDCESVLIDFSATWCHNQWFILCITPSLVTFFYSGKNIRGNLRVMCCCCFMTTHLFTTSTLHRLLFSIQASPNWITLHIFQILHPTIIDLFSNPKNFLRSRYFETDDEAIMTMNHYLESLDSDFSFET